MNQAYGRLSTTHGHITANTSWNNTMSRATLHRVRHGMAFVPYHMDTAFPCKSYMGINTSIQKNFETGDLEMVVWRHMTRGSFRRLRFCLTNDPPVTWEIRHRWPIFNAPSFPDSITWEFYQSACFTILDRNAIILPSLFVTTTVLDIHCVTSQHSLPCRQHCPRAFRGVCTQSCLSHRGL